MKDALREAAPAEFYDHVLDDPHNAQWKPLHRNPYRPLWERTAALVPKGRTVVELGCGGGRLAPLLMAHARSYLGIDFAPRLIDLARRNSRGRFLVADLRTDPIPDAQVYVANEVLEHLDDDLALLRRLPEGSLVVLSVPSFDSRSHVRYFPEQGSARVRYGAVLRIDHAEVVNMKRGAYFHLLRGTR